MEDLPRRSTGHHRVVDDFDRPRPLVAGEPAPAPLDQLIRRRRFTVSEHDHRVNGLSPFVVGDADDRHVANLGVVAQEVLHLGGVDVLAAADDQVPLAVDEMVEAVFITAGEVADGAVVAAEGLGRLSGGFQ